MKERSYLGWSQVGKSEQIRKFPRWFRPREWSRWLLRPLGAPSRSPGPYCVSSAAASPQPWRAAGPCGCRGSAAWGAAGEGCAAAGRTGRAAGLPGCQPRCWWRGRSELGRSWGLWEWEEGSETASGVSKGEQTWTVSNRAPAVCQHWVETIT